MSAGGVARRKGRSAVTQHPLEPLSADEFRRIAEILRRDGHVTDTFRFASIELTELGKQQREQQLEHVALGVYEQLVTEVPDAGERRQAVLEADHDAERIDRVGEHVLADEGVSVARFAFLHPDTSLKLVHEVLARTE